MSTTFCGSPLIGMNPPSKPSLRTHLMILVPDCTITKPKFFLIPEAEHCSLNYYGFLSMTITGAKVHLGSDCSVKNPYPVGWHIPDSPYMAVPPPPQIVPRSDLHISLAGCRPLLGNKTVQLRSVKDSCF